VRCSCERGSRESGRHLVAGNAAIWIAGELPDEFVVTISPGPRVVPPDVTDMDGLVTPTS
jgi:hypothetical protein